METLIKRKSFSLMILMMRVRDKILDRKVLNKLPKILKLIKFIPKVNWEILRNKLIKRVQIGLITLMTQL